MNLVLYTFHQVEIRSFVFRLIYNKFDPLELLRVFIGADIIL